MAWFRAPFTVSSALSALLLAGALASVPAYADWHADLQPAQFSGQGDFKFLGLPIYHAELWSVRLPVDFDARFALQLTYARDISRERLADTAIDEMKRLAPAELPAQTLERWHEDMLRSLTDVSRGDRLSAVFLPHQGVRFYAGDRLTAEIDDPTFARAFFDVWLDPKSRGPTLRRQLLGEPTPQH
ncbi:MAG: chalcone isomerase family protein [Janthinobacterium lividum]